MPRPSNADLLARYRAKLEFSRKWRREEGYDALWTRMIDMYRGKHYEFLSPEDRLLVNVAFSTVNVIGPSVAVNNPKIAVNATKPENAANAIITEAVVNYWWRHYRVRPQFRRAVKDFLVIGHGWVKSGYRYVEESRVGDDDDLSDANEEGGVAQAQTVVTADCPFAERVSPFDVFVDPDATAMSDLRWIAQRIKRPLREVRSDRRYSKAAREACAATTWQKNSNPEDVPHKKVQDTDEGYVEVFEFYDITKGTISVFADGGDAFLVTPRKMPYAFGHPFVMIRNYDVPDFFYPMGDLEAIEPLQRELNATRTAIMNHRKRYARKYLYSEDRFDSNGRAALESDADNVMVPVKGDDPIDKAVAPFPTVITPPEFYDQSAMIQADVEQVSGVSEYMRGSLPEIRRTATEAAIVQDASNARAADKLATIEQSIGEVAGRLVQLAQQYMSGEQVARIVGKDGEPAWVTFDADYIKGEFDYEVEAGSTAPVNESFRRQMALQMVDAMVPFVQAGVIDPRKLAAHVLQFGFGIKDAETWLAGPQMAGLPPDGQVPPDGAVPPEGAVPPPAPDAGLPPIDPAILAALSSRPGMGAPLAA